MVCLKLGVQNSLIYLSLANKLTSVLQVLIYQVFAILDKNSKE